MDPINYTMAVNNPLEMALQGYQAGSAIRQQQDSAASAAQMKGDLVGLASHPDAGAQDYLGLMAKYPEMSDKLKSNWDMLDNSRQQSNFDSMTKAYSALSSGRPEIAQEMLQSSFDAAKNSGDVQAASGAKAMMKILESNPEAAKTSLGIMMAGTAPRDRSSFRSRSRR